MHSALNPPQSNGDRVSVLAIERGAGKMENYTLPVCAAATSGRRTNVAEARSMGGSEGAC